MKNIVSISVRRLKARMDEIGGQNLRNSFSPLSARHTCTYQFDKEKLQKFLAPNGRLEEVMFVGVVASRGYFFCHAEHNDGFHLLASISETDGENDIIARSFPVRECSRARESGNSFASEECAPSFVSGHLDSSGYFHLLEERPLCEYWEDGLSEQIYNNYSLFSPDFRLLLDLCLGSEDYLLAPSWDGEVYLVDLSGSTYEQQDLYRETWAFFPARSLLETSLDLARSLSFYVRPPDALRGLGVEELRVSLGGQSQENYLLDNYSAGISLYVSLPACPLRHFYRCSLPEERWELVLSAENCGSPFLPVGSAALLFSGGEDLLFYSESKTESVAAAVDFSSVDRLVSGGGSTAWALESDSGRAYRIEVGRAEAWKRASRVLQREATHAIYRPGGSGYEKARLSFRTARQGSCSDQ